MKIGILSDSLIQSGFNGEVINNILKCEDFEISTIIVNNLPSKKKKFFMLFKKFSIIRILEKFLLVLIYKFERFIYKKNFKKFKFHSINLDNLKSTKIVVTPNISKNNLFYYNKKDVEKLKSLNLDVVIRMCSGIIKGDILNIAKFGIISYHHGDNNLYRGMPPGFWEVYNKEPSTGFIIQKLNEELDNGELLLKGFVTTKTFYYFNNLNILKLSSKYIIDVLNKIHKREKFREYRKKIYFNPLNKDPNLLNLFNYIFKIYSHIIFKKAENIFFKKSWRVAFAKGNLFKKRLENYKIIKNNKNSFIADPFLWKYKDKNYLFVEEYDYIKNKAVISCYLLNNNNAEYIGVIIEEDFHLSFPFIFQFNNNFYLCPETSKINEIRLYECVEFPLKWKYCKTILKNINAVDTILFEKDSIWWLLTNSRDDGMDPSNELNIFYSKDGPLTEKWISHKTNPIYIDINNSRNGGIVYEDKKIYRVSQKPGFGHYGKEFNLNLIDEINETTFKELNICTVKPNFFKNINGTHHFNNNDEYCVIDFI